LPSRETTYATVLTVARVTTRAGRKTGPFTRARRKNSVRMTAMMGVELIATPIANVRTR
jgi:hypothetical protein